MKKTINRTEKHVFIVESDKSRQAEISEALLHQKTWTLSFFNSTDECIASTGPVPMVVFLDIEHFASQSSDNKAIDVINNLRNRWEDVVVIVFCDSDKEHKGAETLSAGAMDYIVLNNHQFARMENELTWIEQVLDQRAEDKKQKRFLLLLTLGMLFFMIVLIILDYLGYIKEGTQPDILIGD